MKISSTTISLLKNYATINQSILIKPGNKLVTQDTRPSILARAEVTEEFPVNIAIYDLHQFLGTLAMMGDCDVTFGDKSVVLKASKHSTEYFYSPANLIKESSAKQPSGGEFFTFELSEHDVSRLLKASALFSAPTLSIIGDGGKVIMSVGAPKTDSFDSPSNNYQVDLGSCEKDFDFRVPVENLKIIPTSYKVELSEKLFAKFTATASTLMYWLAADPDSKV